MMDARGKNFLILGLGASGYAAARKLLTLGANVSTVDTSVAYEVMKRAAELQEAGAKSVIWGLPADMLKNQDFLIVSPGVPVDEPVIKSARRRGVAVMSELELAYQLTDSPIIAVTGTNGKSTVVTMLGEIFTTAGVSNLVAGNIGRPLVDAIDEADPETVLIVEVSSFQMETVVDFRPRVAVLLNITEDHIDRHKDMRVYREAKARLFRKQQPEDFAVVNLDDPEVTKVLDGIKSSLVPYSTEQQTERGVFVENGTIWAVLPPEYKPETVGSAGDIHFKGSHNLENALAAIAVGLVWGLPAGDIMKAIANFKGLSHRIEFVAEKGGVKYYDDSKATNPDAVKRALGAFDEPVVLLAGGRNKGMDFSSLKSVLEKKVKAAVLFGESADELAGIIKDAGRTPSATAKSIEEAVNLAAERAVPGDAVLLSPGCASFDMFNGYAERGQAFQDAVRALPDGSAGGD
ncbi:MAG: UDP-N-acetylmuramoyl-L-alanine--D-glutamate ligase [Actinomycetota bacterium]